MNQQRRHEEAMRALQVLESLVSELECTLAHNGSCECRDCLRAERDELRAEVARLGARVFDRES